MNHMDFFKDIAKDIRKSYVFIGTEEFVKDSALTTLRKKILDETRVGFNLSIISEDGSIDEVYDAVNLLPFMAERRMVIWHATKQLKEMKEQGLKLLKEMLLSLGDTVCLVIIIKGSADKRLKYYKVLNENSSVVEFNDLDSFEATRWVGSFFKKNQKQIDMKTAEAIVNLIGTSVRDLYNEVSKILVYMGDRATVSEKDLELFANHYTEDDIFELLKMFFAGNISQGVDKIHRLVERNKKGDRSNDAATKLIGAFSTKLLKCYQVKVMVDKKMSRETIMDFMDISKGEAYYLIEDSKRFTMEQLKAGIESFAYADYALKNGLMTGNVAVEYAIINSFL